MGVEVIAPIFANNEIYGLILLRSRQQVQQWSEEEITTLFNVGAQIGLNIRVRDFERRSSQVDKLVALGTMAAGLSHEIRNPLVSVQTLSSLLSSRKSLDQMPEDFRSVLVQRYSSDREYRGWCGELFQETKMPGNPSSKSMDVLELRVEQIFEVRNRLCQELSLQV